VAGEWAASPFRTSLVLGHDGALRVLQGFPGDDDCYPVWSSPPHQDRRQTRRRWQNSDQAPSSSAHRGHQRSQNLTEMLAALADFGGMRQPQLEGQSTETTVAAATKTYVLSRVEASRREPSMLVITWNPGRLRRAQRIWSLDLDDLDDDDEDDNSTSAATKTSPTPTDAVATGHSSSSSSSSTLVPAALAPWIGRKRDAGRKSSSSEGGGVLWLLPRFVHGQKQQGGRDDSSLPPVWVEALAVGAADLVHTLHHPFSPKRSATPLSLLPRPPPPVSAATEADNMPSSSSSRRSRRGVRRARPRQMPAAAAAAAASPTTTLHRQRQQQQEGEFKGPTKQPQEVYSSPSSAATTAPPTAMVALAKAVAAIGLNPPAPQSVPGDDDGASSNAQSSAGIAPTSSAAEVAYRAAMKLGAGLFTYPPPSQAAAPASTTFAAAAATAGSKRPFGGAGTDTSSGGGGGGTEGGIKKKSREELLWEVLPKILGERARERRRRAVEGEEEQ